MDSKTAFHNMIMGIVEKMIIEMETTKRVNLANGCSIHTIRHASDDLQWEGVFVETLNDGLDNPDYVVITLIGGMRPYNEVHKLRRQFRDNFVERIHKVARTYSKVTNCVTGIPILVDEERKVLNEVIKFLWFNYSLMLTYSEHDSTLSLLWRYPYVMY
jgi:hypothetical protein